MTINRDIRQPAAQTAGRTATRYSNCSDKVLPFQIGRQPMFESTRLKTYFTPDIERRLNENLPLFSTNLRTFFTAETAVVKPEIFVPT